MTRTGEGIALRLEGLRVVAVRFDEGLDDWERERDPTRLDGQHYGMLEVLEGHDFMGGERWRPVWLHEQNSDSVARRLYLALCELARMRWQAAP